MKDTDFLDEKITSTSSFFIATPTCFPSGQFKSIENLFVSSGILLSISRLSYPSLIIKNVHFDSIPKGTTGIIISFLSNYNLGTTP